ncbi:alpha-ketoglutarate-dependent dioxygenase AlkB [Streptomyces sp. NPDC002619]|uniref:alpha-ketoglutarate-dependent dioxygenase AlkB n=1 Tax=Streptomyces sp. NPDC002619 TaxID=3364655 RepID=UPI0036AB5251
MGSAGLAGRHSLSLILARTRLGSVTRQQFRTPAQQRDLVTACRVWAAGPVPIRHTRLPRGGVVSIQTVCVGRHWHPYAYTRTAGDVNGERVAPFPGMVRLGRLVLLEAYGDQQAAGDHTPDTALSRCGRPRDDSYGDCPSVREFPGEWGGAGRRSHRRVRCRCPGGRPRRAARTAASTPASPSSMARTPGASAPGRRRPGCAETACGSPALRQARTRSVRSSRDPLRGRRAERGARQGS